MKELIVDKYSWSNVSGEKYFKIVDILDDPETKEIEKQVAIIALIEDKPESEIWNLPISESTKLIQKLEFLNHLEISKIRRNSTIVLGDTRYTIMNDLFNMTTAQFIDFKMTVQNLDLRYIYDGVISIFLIPEGKTYGEDYDIEELKRRIRTEIGFDMIQSLLNFILRVYLKYVVVSLTYTRKQIKKIKNKEQREAALKSYQSLREEMLTFIPTFVSLNQSTN